MSCKWKRSSQDICIEGPPQNISFVKLLNQRELGTYSRKNKTFNVIQYFYYAMFPITTPRYIVIHRKGDKYQNMEFKFHPNCKNGC